MNNIIIRHINLSGDMYSRLVYGEENDDKKYYFQKFPYEDDSLTKKWLGIAGRRENYIEPRFRVLDKKCKYIYIVSLWGEVEIRKKIIERLHRMNKKYHNIKIVGYWSDPAFDLNNYRGCKFDLLIQSVSEQINKWPNAKYLHVPVATLGYDDKKEQQIEHDCFSIGNSTELRLDKSINSERQFHRNKIDCFWCIARMYPNPRQNMSIMDIKKYRKFPDVDSMSADETLQMSAKVNVMLNISRLKNSYQTNPSYYAVIFNKKLLIDSERIKEIEYYDSRYMKVVDFSDPSWLTPSLAKWMKKVERIEYGYRGEWKPEVFYLTIKEMAMKGWR